MSLFERFLSIQGYSIRRAERELGMMESWSHDQLMQWQARQRRAQAEFHFTHNPLYSEKVGKTLPDRWDDLPTMSKSDYQRELRSLITRDMKLGDLYQASTSGSSGHPFVFVKDKYAHACSWALIKDRYGWHGLSLDSKQARFYGIPLERMQYLKEQAKDRLMNRVRFPIFDMSDPILEKYVRKFRGRRFDYIYGYTNSLVLFARYLLRRGTQLCRLCPTLRLCITTSEVCAEEDRQLLKEAFGVDVVNEYGASEVGIIAFDDGKGDWILSDENLFLEVVDDENRPVADGTIGSILVTDLRNRAFPFLRYRIGDLGAIKADADEGRDSRRKLLQLYGRENDVILLPSGRKSPGLTFYYISRSILESSGALREFIIRQTALNEFMFEIVSDRALTPEEERLIREKMDRYLEPGLRVAFRQVSAIHRPPSGKIKHFYSEVGQGDRG
jgi:phenylacetate-CoA ligase